MECFGRPRERAAALIVGALTFMALLFTLPLEQASQRLGAAIVYGFCALATGFAYFLFFLFIAPWKLHQRQHAEIVELRARLGPQELVPLIDLVSGEIVIAGVVTIVGVPSPLPAGTYLVARRVLVTNRSTEHEAALSIKLRVKMSDRDRVAEPFHPPRPTAEPLMGSFAHELVGLLSEQPLPHPINLDSRKAAGGRILFYLSLSLKNEAHAQDISRCDMEWEIYDSVSQTTLTYPVRRTQERWRVLPSPL